MAKKEYLVKPTAKGQEVMAAMQQLIQDVRTQLEITYYREIQALQDNYPCTEELAKQMAWMALCEFRADLLGEQIRKGQRQ